jgi:hypothetical protein
MTSPFARPNIAMLRRILFLAAIALLATAPLSLHAQAKAGARPAAQPGLNFVLEGAFEFGGARLIELQFTNGDTQTLTAGQGGTIAAGLQYRPAALPKLSIAGTVGYKFVTNASENADIGISRVPVEVIGRWSLDPDWWVGAGVVQHNSVNIEGDGFIPDAEMESSTGATLELGWRWIALSYTALEYTGPNGDTFDAGSIGVVLRWVVGKK